MFQKMYLLPYAGAPLIRWIFNLKTITVTRRTSGQSNGRERIANLQTRRSKHSSQMKTSAGKITYLREGKPTAPPTLLTNANTLKMIVFKTQVKNKRRQRKAYRHVKTGLKPPRV